jgi:hypothetical protein
MTHELNGVDLAEKTELRNKKPYRKSDGRIGYRRVQAPKGQRLLELQKFVRAAFSLRLHARPSHLR